MVIKIVQTFLAVGASIAFCTLFLAVALIVAVAGLPFAAIIYGRRPLSSQRTRLLNSGVTGRLPN